MSHEIRIIWDRLFVTAALQSAILSHAFAPRAPAACYFIHSLLYVGVKFSDLRVSPRFQSRSTSLIFILDGCSLVVISADSRIFYFNLLLMHPRHLLCSVQHSTPVWDLPALRLQRCQALSPFREHHVSDCPDFRSRATGTQLAAMGMCAIRGPLVMDDRAEAEEVELNSPRSCTTTTTTTTSYTGFGSASSQELDHIAEAVSHYYEDGALWQRTIPRGRRCKPLSFAGVILYDENGNLIISPQQEVEEETDEYFSPQRNLAEREEEFRSCN